MTIKLEVQKRDEKTTAAEVRETGNVPAVVYGPKQEPLSISVSAKDFEKVLKEAGEATILELTGLDGAVEVLIKDVEFNPVKQVLNHVDFYAIERGKDMNATVPLHFIGEAPVEDSKQGTVNKVLHEVEVTCRPSKLPSHIDVDLSSLATVEDKIHISDLVIPEGVKLEADPADAVAVVSPARKAVETDENTEIDMEAIEVEQKGKDNTEE